MKMIYTRLFASKSEPWHKSIIWGTISICIMGHILWKSFIVPIMWAGHHQILCLQTIAQCVIPPPVLIARNLMNSLG